MVPRVKSAEDCDVVETVDGPLRVHMAGECDGRACAVHAPSGHHMRDWPLRWRNDVGVMERICPCGVGHPDPDHLAYVRTKNQRLGDLQAVHGCCGCCDPSLAPQATYHQVTRAVAERLTQVAQLPLF